jgi:hypothetical protein
MIAMRCSLPEAVPRKGVIFFGRVFSRRRWPANIKVGTGRFAGLVAIIMARESGLPFIWRMRKKLVPEERVIRIYKFFVPWFKRVSLLRVRQGLEGRESL